jgi:hypothetical protein
MTRFNWAKFLVAGGIVGFGVGLGLPVQAQQVVLSPMGTMFQAPPVASVGPQPWVQIEPDMEAYRESTKDWKFPNTYIGAPPEKLEGDRNQSISIGERGAGAETITIGGKTMPYDEFIKSLTPVDPVKERESFEASCATSGACIPLLTFNASSSAATSTNGSSSQSINPSPASAVREFNVVATENVGIVAPVSSANTSLPVRSNLIKEGLPEKMRFVRQMESPLSQSRIHPSLMRK